MPRRIRLALIIAEVVLCFALPAYFLFWGVVTLPIWLMGASAGAAHAVIDVIAVLGGCLGVWTLLRVLRFYLTARASRAPNWPLMVILATVGIASLWVEMTGQLASFELDWFSLASMVLPTLCAAHILALGIRKSLS